MPKMSTPYRPDIDPTAEAAPRRRRRGRPSSHEPRPLHRVRPSKADALADLAGVESQINNILNTNKLSDVNGVEPKILEDLEKVVKEVDLQSKKMTLQELKFIEHHLVRGLPIRKAMMLAGYDTSVESTMYFRAKKIVQKLEECTEDHRKIMRLVGAGEVAITAGLLALAESDHTPATARVAAYTTLGKWLGMAKEEIAGKAGLTIIIEGPRQQQQIVGPAPAQKTLPAPSAPPEQWRLDLTKEVEITK